ncbi:zinc finger A20 and AN1 domain-containing stress-associated protein [Acrasis kona]|uniref:Zinc finger A20 and AN1 domain-containing stress-associated protein n=1 Tax=Acrasis kona TaxID=1008807 RepID=A0AAW2Z604_9EUKA
MSSRNDDSKPMPPAEEIDGLQVKKNLNANLNVDVKVPTTNSQIPSLQVRKEVEAKDIGQGRSNPNKRPINRCFECRKKVPISALKCKCDHTFCAEHRLAEDHNCTFDFKSLYRKKLADDLSKVVSSKVLEI